MTDLFTEFCKTCIHRGEGTGGAHCLLCEVRYNVVTKEPRPSEYVVDYKVTESPITEHGRVSSFRFFQWCPKCFYRNDAESEKCQECRFNAKAMQEPTNFGLDPEIYKTMMHPQSSTERPIKDSGERTVFSTGFQRDMHTGKGRMDLLPWNAIIAVSKHCENGALKYGEHNVDLGCPMHSLMDSGMRHAAKVLIGMDDEPHLEAACWNFLWALEMKLTRPDMTDIPWKPEDKENK